MSDKISFKDACRELGVSEAELEQLVAAGEIASVKEGDTLYFASDVIQRFKENRPSDATVLLADEELNLLEDDEIDLLADDDDVAASAVGKASDEISLDDELDLETDDLLGDVGAAAGGLVGGAAAASGLSADDTDESLLDMDELDLLGEDASEATTPVPSARSLEAAIEEETASVGELGDDTLLDTELLDLGDDDDSFDLDAVGDDDFDDETSILRGGGARVMQMKRKESHAAWTALLAVASFLLLLPLGVLVNLMFLRSGGAVVSSDAHAWIDSLNVLDPVVQWVAGLF